MRSRPKITQEELDGLLAALEEAQEERRAVVGTAHTFMLQRDRARRDAAKLRDEIKPLREFYKLAAKVECEGKCGKFQPVLQDSEHGSRTRNGEWLCPPCHSKVCGVDVTLKENRWHSCEALR